MKTLTLLSLGILAAPALAQINVSVATANTGGVQIMPKTGSQQTANWNHPMTFATYSNLNLQLQNSSNQYYYDYVYSYVYPPYTNSYYGTLNNVNFYNYALARTGSSASSLGTTSDAKGTAGAQQYTVTIKTTSKVPVAVNLNIYGNIYGNSSSKITITGGGANKSWSFTKNGYSYLSDTINLAAFQGTVTLNVTVDSQCTPGGSSPGQYYDGYYTGVYMSVVDGSPGSFNVDSKPSCTNTYKLQGVGTPTKGGYYTIELTGMKQGQVCALLYGMNDQIFRNLLPLPIPLDYMGAKGCQLAVDVYYPYSQYADANGKASMQFYLSPYYSYTYYLQGMIADPTANTAGLVFTGKGTLKW